jgi:N-acetylglucosamine-6-phosphate deacetylase
MYDNTKIGDEVRSRTGCILTPDGWFRGTIQFTSHVEWIDGVAVDGPSSDESVILPGFIDLHVHGGGGADVMEGDRAIDAIAQLHARHGTTSMLATTVTASHPELERALTCVGRAVKERGRGAARILGAHLEGPYINHGKLGAQPDCSRPASIDELRALHALAPIRIVTLAPELTGHLEFVRLLTKLGIVAQCGHSAGSYEDGVAAMAAGMKGFTHLYNAMSPLHHRNPGMVGAAFAHAKYAEIIPDLLHVHSGAIRAAMRAIPYLYCVTDSTAAAGMPDGEYRLGTHTVTKCMGGVRLPDGTLAGSTLTMDQALRNLVEIGLTLDDAARRLSTFPADYIGANDRGRLQRGAWADIAVLKPNLELQAVFVEGESIELIDA